MSLAEGARVSIYRGTQNDGEPDRNLYEEYAYGVQGSGNEGWVPVALLRRAVDETRTQSAALPTDCLR